MSIEKINRVIIFFQQWFTRSLDMSIKNRLLFSLLACSILPMIFVGTLGYFNAKKALQNTRIEALKSITYHKAKKIEDFFSEQKKPIRIAQRRPNIKKYASILAGFSGDFSSPDYKIIRDGLDGTLKMYPPVYDYANNMLANPQGKIVYVLNRYSALEDMDNFRSEARGKSFKKAITQRNFVLILVIAVIVLSLFLAHLVAKSISDPVQMLQKGSEEIGRGNLDLKVGTDAKDEIGRLGRAFDKMAKKLKTVTASRDELNHEINERKKAMKALS
jgi:methyl-accepting chemotaxis protein